MVLETMLKSLGFQNRADFALAKQALHQGKAKKGAREATADAVDNYNNQYSTTGKCLQPQQVMY